jgi:DNA-binding response OmpR family regulator
VAESGEAHAPPGSPIPEGRGGTILLVEDELGVRKYIRQALERHGYTVIEAGSGEEALDLASGPNAGIDLLVTDMVMPGMSGMALVERLGAKRGAIPVLCMSGYLDRLWQPDDATVSFLQKPFTVEGLLRRVSELLTHRDRAANAG